MDFEKIAPFEFIQKKVSVHFRVSYEADATFFRIDLSLLVFELWAFEVFDFKKGFGLGKILPPSNLCTGQVRLGLVKTQKINAGVHFRGRES